MSSNIRVQKVCEECQREFTAKTTVTRCCSDICAKRLYKRKNRKLLLDQTEQNTRAKKVVKLLNQSIEVSKSSQLLQSVISKPIEDKTVNKELLNIAEMAFVVGVSKRTFQRLIITENIPRLYIGKRILFNKKEVLHYLTTKNQTNERQTPGETQDKRKEGIIY